MRENAVEHTHWVSSCAVYAPSLRARGLSAKGESSLFEMSKSVTLLQLVYRTEPQFRQRLAARSRFRNRHCRPPGLLHMLHPSVRHYAANRISRSTGSGAERELKSKGLDNLHHSREDSRSIRTSNQSISSARRVGSNRDRRSQVCIEESRRELQARCRRKAEASRKEVTPLVSIVQYKNMEARFRL
jgi:hypothetical protein